MEDVKIEFNLTDAQALALAQFVKRVRWTEVRQNAVGDDEADLNSRVLVVTVFLNG